MNNYDKSVNTSSYVILSLLSLIFLVLIYLISPRSVNPYKIYFIIIFIFICLLGIWAAIYPRHCLSILNIQTANRNECREKKLQIMGHHPDCGEFNKHIFSFKNKIYCVGCTGLLVGGILAITTSLLYLLFGTREILLWTGLIMVLASLFQLTLLNLENKMIKFFTNLGLVWGSALIFTGLLDYSNIFIGIYFLFVVVALIITRSAVSDENHRLLCTNCQLN